MLKTAQQYVQSIENRRTKIYLLGERVENWVEHPIIRPAANAIAMTYKLSHETGASMLVTTDSNITTSPVNRFNSLFLSTDDLVKKVKMQRLLGQRTGCCFQRCVGMDAINATYSTTFEVDKKHGTEYHRRFKNWLKTVQDNDLCISGSMTDAKGHRGLSPSEQADPDMFVHIVERKRDGIVIRGAKAHQTGCVNSHEMLVMPTMRMQEKDRDYAVCCAVPTDSEGLVMIVGRQSCDTRKLERGDIDIGNLNYGGIEALVVFENVFVPWERVFMEGEYDLSSMIVERFASYHRQSYGGCKAGVADVLIGATASIAEYNGVRTASHIRDKLSEMVHMTETIHSCGLACSYEGWKTPAGNFQSHTLLANVCKLNVTRFPYELCRLAEDIAGGILVTAPSEKDLKNPETGGYINKYLKGVPEIATEQRLRMLSLVHSMTTGTTAPSFRTESMHGAGSPQAQKIMIEREADMEFKKKLARNIAGIDKREEIYLS